MSVTWHASKNISFLNGKSLLRLFICSVIKLFGSSNAVPVSPIKNLFWKDQIAKWLTVNQGWSKHLLAQIQVNRLLVIQRPDAKIASKTISFSSTEEDSGANSTDRGHHDHEEHHEEHEDHHGHEEHGELKDKRCSISCTFLHKLLSSWLCFL